MSYFDSCKDLDAADVMSRWLVTGAAGMLGRDLVTCLRGNGEAATAVTRQDLDITDEAAVRAAVSDHSPDIVVNCAALTAVDDAEARENAALQVNGAGAANVAAACAAEKIRLIHVSTDYVFGEDAHAAYSERDLRTPAPHTGARNSPQSRLCTSCSRRPVAWCGRPGCTALMGRTSSAR